MVIDADALNALTSNIGILRNLKAPAVLTPHPGEMARLMDTSVQNIQKDRIVVARDFAKTFNVYLVLKGAKTIISSPDGRIFINPTGNSGMASGGMGDVLTGIIAGFITQGMDILASAVCGVYIHGKIADRLSKQIGFYGFLASDLIREIPQEIRNLS
ncbi:MAG: NAD(P)H-hydrate dehydratase [Desulfobacterales bacterium]|nr:NAD(P)H-hydrate dehydratase [Desulfobacterales bacterium]